MDKSQNSGVHRAVPLIIIIILFISNSESSSAFIKNTITCNIHLMRFSIIYCEKKTVDIKILDIVIILKVSHNNK